VVAPGIVVALWNTTQPTWGVTIPYGYWRKNSKKDVVARFEEYSEPDCLPDIPYLEFSNGEKWEFRFGSFPSDIDPLCWLDDFTGVNVNKKVVPHMMLVCSRRDGGRYYRELFDELRMLARGASQEFTSDELRKEAAGVQSLIAHSRAIRAWQMQNPVWRDWKSTYESQHRLHVNLF
jgi:hypothetical protein